MPKVMIEMEMPNGCRECKLYDRESCILDDMLLCEDNNRPRKCPLQEVKED